MFRNLKFEKKSPEHQGLGRVSSHDKLSRKENKRSLSDSYMRHNAGINVSEASIMNVFGFLYTNNMTKRLLYIVPSNKNLNFSTLHAKIPYPSYTFE